VYDMQYAPGRDTDQGGRSELEVTSIRLPKAPKRLNGRACHYLPCSSRQQSVTTTPFADFLTKIEFAV
jgi:hypothetical protein